jgi:hypothetical protein
LLIATDLDALLDDRMGESLLTKTKDAGLKPHVFGALLQFLMRHGIRGACELAESYITAPIRADDPDVGRLIVAMHALIEETPGADWLKIWPIIANNTALGRRVIESLSHLGFGETRFVEKLSESQLGELYRWMVRAYPYGENRLLGARAMGPTDMAAMLRDGILEHLKRRSNFAACGALRDIVENLPQYPGLRHQLEEAETLARAATWQTIAPREFLTLVRDRDKRLIENGEQLVEVVLESLDRLNSKLHGELYPVKYLWVPSNGAFRPRDEEDCLRLRGRPSR